MCVSVFVDIVVVEYIMRTIMIMTAIIMQSAPLDRAKAMHALYPKDPTEYLAMLNLARHSISSILIYALNRLSLSLSLCAF